MVLVGSQVQDVGFLKPCIVLITLARTVLVSSAAFLDTLAESCCWRGVARPDS